MVRKHYLVFWLFIFAAMTACDRRNPELNSPTPDGQRTSSVASDTVGGESSEKTEGDITSAEPTITSAQLKDPTAVSIYVKKMGEYIRNIRRSKWPMDADYPIVRLFAVWNPIGRSASELKELIGEPTMETEDNLSYYLPTDRNGAGEGVGYGFTVKDGKIIGMFPDDLPLGPPVLPASTPQSTP